MTRLCFRLLLTEGFFFVYYSDPTNFVVSFGHSIIIVIIFLRLYPKIMFLLLIHRNMITRTFLQDKKKSTLLHLSRSQVQIIPKKNLDILGGIISYFRILEKINPIGLSLKILASYKKYDFYPL